MYCEAGRGHCYTALALDPRCERGLTCIMLVVRAPHKQRVVLSQDEGNQAPGTKINNTGDNGETIVLGEHDWVETEGTILIFRLRRWKQTRTKGL